MSSRSRWLWIGVAAILLTFAIPWFLWGNDQLLLGLPLWLWWHIGWLGLAAVVFYLFTKTAWGLGITDGDRT